MRTVKNHNYILAILQDKIKKDFPAGPFGGDDHRKIHVAGRGLLGASHELLQKEILPLQLFEGPAGAAQLQLQFDSGEFRNVVDDFGRRRQVRGQGRHL
ncbi:MAG: hypothetical protein LBU12_09370 [Deltaproteobacteria bacterium]|nr:hypothetical protein [Deltaproteobacteria bacterium]